MSFFVVPPPPQLEKVDRGLGRKWRCRSSAGENTYANDAVRANELDLVVGGGAGGVALGISAEVAEVTNVALLVGRGTVVLATGVDWRMKLAWSSIDFVVCGSSGFSFSLSSFYSFGFCFLISLFQYHATLLSSTSFSYLNLGHLDMEQ